ncbi:hypothetical protein KUI26_004452 [Salmonella enterica]|nr:hypothetical protein [Salmonella enterica]EHG3238206.1 hypothetical protein [Salmonella enterica]EHR7011237.1 hypothetical protein [Salmonella enterica]
MTTRDNGGPGKTRHLNDIVASCEALGMRVICVNATERDFWLSASQQCATAPDGKARISLGVLQRERGHCLFLGKPGSGMSVTKQQMTRVFLAKSDVSQIKALYSGEDGERLAAAIRDNCSVWFPLNPGGNGNDA